MVAGVVCSFCNCNLLQEVGLSAASPLSADEESLCGCMVVCLTQAPWLFVVVAFISIRIEL